MDRHFRRKPNNLKRYLVFVRIAIPSMVLFWIGFPIALVVTGEAKPADQPMLFAISGMMLLVTALAHRQSRRQVASKRAYMAMMDVPILTLTETHLIYRFDDLEQYLLPWKQIVKIEKNETIARRKELLGTIAISCSPEMDRTIAEVRKNGHFKDRAGTIVIPIMDFDVGLDALYREILEYYHRGIID